MTEIVAFFEIFILLTCAVWSIPFFAWRASSHRKNRKNRKNSHCVIAARTLCAKAATSMRENTNAIFS
nr:MAG TPA: hypothetical protein [Caudoviricetes sp.]